MDYENILIQGYNLMKENMIDFSVVWHAMENLQGFYVVGYQFSS